MEYVSDNQRFENIQFKVTIAASNCNSDVIAHNLSTDHSH